MHLEASVARFLEAGSLWLAPGESRAPDGTAVVATSGSGGKPKLVILPRDSLVTAAESAAQRLGTQATWHLALPGHYVAGLMVLVRGLLGDGVREARPDLSGLQLADGPNAISLVPTQLYRALEEPRALRRLAACDAVLVGGGALDAGLRARALEAGVPVVETYGMSETSGGVVWDGVALPGTRIALEADGRIIIAGPTLFAGYLGCPELTASALREGQLRTQDRGRWEAGRLVVEGRVDDVVISGGVNVDLAEVRAAAAALDPETAVFAVPDPEWGARVVLFGTSGTLTGWRERLRGRLPAAWLPREVVLVEAIPRGPGGKPDRRELISVAVG